MADVKIRGVPLDVFNTITIDVSQARYAGNLMVASGAHSAGRREIVARLRVADGRGPGARTSARGRHGPYACWHAYRDVLREVFERFPQAGVRTMLEKYAGADEFADRYPATGERNIGSEFNPACLPALCVADGCGADPAPWRDDQGMARYPLADPEETGDVLARIDRALRQAEQMPPEPFIFEGPPSLLDAPILAYTDTEFAAIDWHAP